MSKILLKNATDQIQSLMVREPSTRRLHTIQVVAGGSVDIDIVQVTHDVKSRVQKGIFRAFDENGRLIDFDKSEALKNEELFVDEGNNNQTENDKDVKQDEKVQVEEQKTEKLKHLGGGYYELPNGERVRGREAAEKALAELEAAENAKENVKVEE